MKTRSQLITTMVLVLGILILANILSEKYFFRLDLTKDKRYTLSNATKSMLRNLEEPVTVTAYFSKDATPDLEKLRMSVKRLMVEYSNVSKGDLVFEIIDPDGDEEKERKAQEDGIYPQLIPVQDKNLTVPKEAYLGAVIKYGRQKEVLTALNPNALEYQFSSTIKKLTITNKPVIGLVQGHGEPGMSNLAQAQRLLSIMYQVEPVFMNDSVNNLLKYNTIAIVAPKDTLPDSHLQQLDEYLTRGGNIYMALNRVTADLQSSLYGETVSTGLETWLAQKGLIIENNFVIDAQCGSIGVQDPRMPFMQRSFDFPYVPILSNFAEHPITQGLQAVIFQFTSSVTFTGDSSVRFTPLVQTSDLSGTEAAPTNLNIQRPWSENDFPLSKIILGGILEGKLAGNTNSKIIVFADGDFALGSGQQGQQVQPDNVNLMVNSIDWLSDDTGLIELRTKGASFSPLDEIENSKKVFLRWLNFSLPIILVLVLGVLRFQSRQSLRKKRMEEGYV